ncbi:PAS domain-containing sensor histidine kinase [Hymenobacter latericus]|uniref:PAS domain-containing sensor histidine kinase n=1 Tax=Hymenobacter sp. YIM 151858-1 TaxID=2987688 RepID=UPI002226FF57|nr:PAS domain-containing sensor histidine kinase [Hymenobacter sp. YIM 151858-1]UYZ60279.1 PAS domain-containing sensor histidine kinase [Hymenobacter sp. YIM 151858-1]
MHEQQLQHILKHVPAGIATLLGPELKFGFVNEAMQALLGGVRANTPLAEQTGVLTPDLVQVMQQVYATGQPYIAKSHGLQLAASESEAANMRYFDIALEPLNDDHAGVQGLLIFATEVTEQAAAQQRAHELARETRRLDARLRVLTETAPQIIFTVDAAGAYEYVSPQWYYFTGQPSTADLNIVWPLLIHPDDRLRVMYQADAARKAGTGWSYEYRLRRHDGQYRWVLSRALPELHAPDKPVFWHGAVTEVHDQRELADVLRRGEAELRFLADSIPQLIWTADANGFTDYYNRHTAEYTGLSTADLGPTAWVSLLEPSEQASAARRWVHCVASGDDYEGLYRMRRHDGQYRWHIIRARQLSDERGPRWFGTCTDVDDQHRLREVLQAQYDELARTNRDLDTFVYTASHDLKQPLHNLRGLFEELRRTATFQDDEAALMLGMLDEALGQLEVTLQDLAATVQEQRQLAAPAELLDLHSVTEEVLLGLRPQVLETNADIGLDFTAAPSLLYGRANLRSVLHNLLSNALKFTNADRAPVIRITSGVSEAGTPYLRVEDNGLGMSPKHSDDGVFQVFDRQHPHIAGAGVGLYLLQRIVHSRGGHIEVKSTPTQCTRFTVYWFE